MKKSNILYLYSFLFLFSLFSFLISSYYFYYYLINNGDYLISLISSLFSFLITFVSFFTLKNLFFYKKQSVSFLGKVKEVRIEKKFPFVKTTITLFSEDKKFNKLFFKSFLVDLYSKNFSIGQDIYLSKDKQYISIEKSDGHNLLHIKDLFKSKDFLDTTLIPFKTNKEVY